MNRGLRCVCTVFVVALMIGWPIAMAVPAGGGIATANHNEFDGGNDQFTEATDSLLVWERSILPLRADPDAGNAETRIDLHELNFKDNQTGTVDETSANRFEAAVYGTDGEVPINFESASGASVSNFENHEAQVIVASVDPDRQDSEFGGLDAINETIDAALDGDFDELRDIARNEDVTFTVEDDLDTDSDGSLSYDLNRDDPGAYAVMLALPTDEPDQDGFNTDSEDILTLPGEATLVGVEMVLQHENPSTISASDAEPGDDIDITVDTDLSGDINHSVLVYNEDQFLDNDAETNIRLDEELSSDLSDEDIVLEHTIENVNGVGDLTADVDFFGFSASEQVISGTTPLADIVDRFNDEADRNFQRELIGSSTLDASAVAVSDGDASETVTIQTFDNWTDGDYRVVHTASDGTAGGFETSTETITIEETTATTPTSPTGSSSGSPTSSPPETVPPENVAEPPEPPEDVEVEREDEADLEFDESTGETTAVFSEQNNVESITFGFQTSGTVNARNLDGEPDETGPSPGASARVSQITVGEELQDESATIRKRVSLDRLEEIGADAEDLQMNRFDASEGEWQGLETEVIGETDTHARVRAETPGFSFFSVSATSEPAAVIQAPDEIEQNEEFTLDGSESSTEYGEVEAWEWTVNGETLTGETITTSIDEPGEADIELTVTNDADETDTATDELSVLQVEDEPAPGTDPDPDAGADPDETGSGLIIGIVVFLAIAVLAILLYVRQQGDGNDSTL